MPEQDPGAPSDAPGDPVSAKGPGKPRRSRPELTPAQRALALLVRREHSKPELTRKLTARGIAPNEAADAIQAMATAGWQDDTRFASSLARARVMNGYGPQRIRAELASHGLAPEVISAAFAALADAGEDDWPALARDLVRRRYGQSAHADPAIRRKAEGLLLRRGFDYDSVRAAMAAEDP